MTCANYDRWIFAVFQIDIKNANVPDSQKRTIPTFLTLYIFGFVYQLVLVWDGLRLKNTIQIIGLVMYNIGLLVYGAVQMEQIEDVAVQLPAEIKNDIWRRTRPFLIAIPAILALGTALLAFAAWKLYDEFAWTIYKHISADLRMKRRYLTFQIYIALLKFDFFFFLGFTVQFVVIVERLTVEFYLTIAAIPVTIAILLAAAFFTRRESLIGTICVIVSIMASVSWHQTNAQLVPLLRWIDILYLQTRPHVFAQLRRPIYPGSQGTYSFCRHHHRFTAAHYHKCVCLRAQLWPRPSTICCQTKDRRGRREAYRQRLRTICHGDAATIWQAAAKADWEDGD